MPPLITVAIGDASTHALVVYSGILADRPSLTVSHHQRAAAMGVGDDITAWPHQLKRKTTRS